jgi:hypothetical protein
VFLQHLPACKVLVSAGIGDVSAGIGDVSAGLGGAVRTYRQLSAFGACQEV